MPGIGVILNPHSKRYRENPKKLDRISAIAEGKAELYLTQDLSDLDRVARECREKGVEVVVLSGGDGTVHQTLTSFIHNYKDHSLPKFTLIRGGTLNLIANTMGLKGSTEKLLTRFLDRFHSGESFEQKKLRLMQINKSFGCVFGLGIVYRFMEKYYENPNLNPLMAAKTVVETVMSSVFNGQIAQNVCQRFDATVHVNGKLWPFANFNGIFAGSVRQIGLNFDVFYHMKNQNDLFHAYGMSVAPRAFVIELGKMFEGKPLYNENVLDQMASEMIIELPEPQAYTIDGDMFEPESRFVLKSGPEIDVLI